MSRYCTLCGVVWCKAATSSLVKQDSGDHPGLLGSAVPRARKALCPDCRKVLK